MSENWKAICEGRLALLNEHAVGCEYLLWNESGVKRVYQKYEGMPGYSQFGGGHTSWAELAAFLDGAREVIYGIEYGDIEVKPRTHEDTDRRD
jgi:hypothetical protein